MSEIYAQSALWAAMFAVAFGVTYGIILSTDPRGRVAKAAGLAVACMCGLFALSAPVFVALSLIEAAQVIR